MRCRHHNIAYLYPNNMLSQEERSRFEAHLHVCNECKKIVEEENRVRSLYQETVFTEPPLGLEDGIFYRLKYKKKTLEPANNRMNVIFTRRIIPAAALLAAVMLFIVLLTPQENDQIADVSSNVNYASIYIPADDQIMISVDSNTAYNNFLSSLNQTVSSNETGQGM